VVGTALSGVLIDAWGWESVFYVFGGTAIVWFIVFTLICYSTPDSHPFITEKEKKFLEEELKDTVNKEVSAYAIFRYILKHFHHVKNIFSACTYLI
jgi:MFS transporter, ACS family, solute carrier family 17 (sodium-dependent inorganic phosphate cotransporter), other